MAGERKSVGQQRQVPGQIGPFTTGLQSTRAHRIRPAKFPGNDEQPGAWIRLYDRGRCSPAMSASSDSLHGAVRWHSDFDAATRCESGQLAQGPAHGSCFEGRVDNTVVQIVVDNLTNRSSAVLCQLGSALQDGRQGVLVNPAKFIDLECEEALDFNGRFT